MTQISVNMIKLILSVAALLHYGWCDLECYDCTSFEGPNHVDGCDQDGYSGRTTSFSSWKSCLTETHNTGSVRRYGSTIPMKDGECMGFGNSMTCYCTASLCNNDLCQDCGVNFTTPTVYPSTTSPYVTESTPLGTTDITDVPGTTPDTTFATGTSPDTTFATGTSPDTTFATGTTPDNTDPTGSTGFTTILETTTQPQPGGGLSCYVCVDCAVVDENTDVVFNKEYKTCVTTIALSGKFIIRGGDYHIHVDGDCVHEDGGMVCYCTGDLCNDQGYHAVQ